MYNEEIKKEFMNTIESESVRSTYKSIFRETEILENEHHIDLSCIPKDIIVNYMMQFNVRSYGTLKNKLKRIVRYQKWVTGKGLVPAEYEWIPYEKIDLQRIFAQNYHMTIFHNPKELRDMFHKYLSAKSDKGVTADQISQAYLALLFQGLKGDDILKLTTNQITIANDKLIISTPNEDIVAYPEFQDIISNVYTTRIFSCQSRNAEYRGERNMSGRLLDNGEGLNDAEMKGRILRKIRKDLRELHLHIDDVYLMGRIYKSIKAGYTHKRNILIACYGENYSKENREKIYNLLNVWDKNE